MPENNPSEGYHDWDHKQHSPNVETYVSAMNAFQNEWRRQNTSAPDSDFVRDQLASRE